MNDRYIRLLRWTLVLAVVATGSCVLFQGCSKQTPTEAPSTTVVKGTTSLSVSPDSTQDSYSFVSGGHNYGKITLALSGYPNASFVCNGILQRSGSTAPDTVYGTFSAVDYLTYILKLNGTDNATRYGQIQVYSIADNNSAQVKTVGFHWLVQTEAGNRNLQ